MEEESGWKFAQCFGDKEDVDNMRKMDFISAVEFDHSGEFLATGDRGGRVVLFQRNSSKKCVEYRFYAGFQSHNPEFDYLKSLEIEEKINKIKWCRRQHTAHFLLTTNDKTIKLWKVFERPVRVVSRNNLGNNASTISTVDELTLPKLQHHKTVVGASPRKIYANAHAYHVNSISINSDDETYLSADDLRINLWNFNITDQSFIIVDIKPANMEELTEVITAAEFHPKHCNIFMYSSSKGTIKLADMRSTALCDRHAKIFEDEDDLNNRSFFSEIISSISDIRFSSMDGRYLLSRDYLTLKLWDVNMENRPVKVIPIHDHLRNRLCDLYENDCIFDKFECHFNGNAMSAMTGSYGNILGIYGLEDGGTGDALLQADKSAFKTKKSAANIVPRSKPALPKSRNGHNDDDGGTGATHFDFMDFDRRILHTSWHPNENTIAVGATNNLFIFTGD